MTEFIDLNMNWNVRVRLTSHGRRIHRERFDRMGSDYPSMSFEYSAPKEDANGWSEWQLHDLMNCFGSHVGMGLSLPFETVIQVPCKQVPGSAR